MPADLRSGGHWTPAQNFKNALIRQAIRFLLAIADRLPEPLLVRICRSLGLLAFMVARKERRIAVSNLLRAFPDSDPRVLARASFANAGESLAATLSLRRSQVRALDRLLVEDSARAALEAALSAGRGAIVVSAHLGAFELIPAAVAELGLEPAIVVRESYDPGLDPVVDAHRRARGIAIIHRGRPGAATRLVRALRRGRPVGILPDLGGRVPSVAVDFLGRSVAFPIGPARLALRTGAPLLIAIALPDARRYRLWVETLAIAGDRPDEAFVTQCVAKAIEAVIRAHPAAWLWMASGPEIVETRTDTLGYTRSILIRGRTESLWSPSKRVECRGRLPASTCASSRLVPRKHLS